MSILHIVRTSAFTCGQLKQCLDTFLETDSIILMDDGCYNINHSLTQNLDENVKIYCITEHLTARGIENSPNNIQLISLKDFLTLTFKHKSSITWQ